MNSYFTTEIWHYRNIFKTGWQPKYIDSERHVFRSLELIKYALLIKNTSFNLKLRIKQQNASHV